jgi:hypothetical protein
MSRNDIITPDTDPDRFLPEEAELFRAGRCSWQTENGDGSGPTRWYCGKPSKRGASFGNCAGHEAELLEDYWPDGSVRR